MVRPAAIALVGAAAVTGVALALLAPWTGEAPVFLALCAAGALLSGTVFLARRSLPGGRGGGALLVALALLVRLPLLLAPPSLSDDLYRYVWDGRLWVAGENPYAVPPEDPSLAGFQGTPLYSSLAHRDLATIYPPLAEALFTALAAAGLGPGGFRAAFALLDALTVLALARILARRGHSPWGAAAYALHPLAALESAGSGHVDCLALALLAWAWERAEAGRPTSSLVAWLGGALAKPQALAAGLFERRRWGGARFALGLGLGGAALAGLLLLSRAAGPASGLLAYLAVWRHNDLVFGGMVAAGLTLAAAKAVGALAILGLALILAARRIDPIAGYAWVALFALLVSPVLHPWYALWALVAVPLLGRDGPRLTAWALAGAVLVAYALPLGARAGTPGFRVLPLCVRVWELAPVLALGLVEAVTCALRAVRR